MNQLLLPTLLTTLSHLAQHSIPQDINTVIKNQNGCRQRMSSTDVGCR